MKNKGVIEKALSNKKARANLAKALMMPLLQRRNYAGIGKSALMTKAKCSVCGNYDEEWYPFNIEFQKMDFYSKGIHYPVCAACQGDTSQDLFEMHKEPLIKMPLLINDSNPFIAHAAAERLKKGI